MIDRYLKAQILRQRGHNLNLVNELLDKLSPESKERLYRIIQNLESENSSSKRKLKHARVGITWK